MEKLFPKIDPVLVDFKRIRLTLTGMVQGVGFRPFIWRLAQDLGLFGWVNNASFGVVIEAEGSIETLRKFVTLIEEEKPPLSFIQSLEFSYLDPIGFKSFEIRQSDPSKEKTAFVLPDISTCPECLKEIFDPSNRRYLYPFTNCTHCGPRYSIVEGLPYDRKNTTMKKFIMCEACQKEYEDPANRRFHAQPNACPECGPHLELWDPKGKVLKSHGDAIPAAVQAIKKGQIVALKGLGGFHLIVDARHEEAVKNLRERKRREEKPFALMFPSLDLVEDICEVSELEKYLLRSVESPIVLLRRKEKSSSKQAGLSSLVAFGNPYLGVMLPHTPLHHILMKELGFPVIATSGNLSDEPICTDEHEALKRLKDMADVFLVHNRPIFRHVDDSIVRVMANRPLVLRRSRGYAPLPFQVSEELPKILAVGGHLKNTVALSVKNNIFISQHIGDLETQESFKAFEETIKSFQNLYDVTPEKIACDLHPEYFSTKYAKRMKAPVKFIQHHHAHVVSCMVENEIKEKVLGVAWDGTGFGLDRTIWGGEFLLSDLKDFKNVASFRKFRLPGGAKAIKEPRRVAIGLLEELFKDKISGYEDLPCFKSFHPHEFKFLEKMLKTGVNSPLTSSVGRIFDAVSSIIGLHQTVNFEGQAAMGLEYALSGIQTSNRYSYDMIDPAQKHKITSHQEMLLADGLTIDWGVMIREMIRDYRNQISAGEISARFHNTLAEIIVDVAQRIAQPKVVLSGGVFQNKYLTEKSIERLQKEGFKIYWHQRIPPNDGGIALGQAVIAAHS